MPWARNPTVMEGDTFAFDGLRGFHSFRYVPPPIYVRYGLAFGRSNRMFLEVSEHTPCWDYVPVRIVLTEKALPWKR